MEMCSFILWSRGLEKVSFVFKKKKELGDWINSKIKKTLPVYNITFSVDAAMC